MRGDRRGQAFTLEGLLSAVVVLTALYLALQAVIITPTTGGAVDPGVRAELRQQADDALVVSAEADSGSLSELVRNWSQSRRTFSGAINPRIGYGQRTPPGKLGEILNATFSERSRTYNIEMRYLADAPGGATNTTTIVDRGSPSESAVIATHRITLYDNMTLTAPTAGPAELWQYDTNPTANPSSSQSGYYPVPNVIDGPVYNIVQVRVVVW